MRSLLSSAGLHVGPIPPQAIRNSAPCWRIRGHSESMREQPTSARRLSGSSRCVVFFPADSAPFRNRTVEDLKECHTSTCTCSSGSKGVNPCVMTVSCRGHCGDSCRDFRIHSPNTGKLVETWDALIELQRRGVVRSIGVSSLGRGIGSVWTNRYWEPALRIRAAAEISCQSNLLR